MSATGQPIRYERVAGKKYKFFGAAVLLLAFVTQMTFVRYAESERRKWDDSTWAHTAARLLALAELNIYFNSGQTTEAYDSNWLRQAAIDEANGLGARIAVSQKEQRQKIEGIREVLATAKAVTSFDGYNAFIQKIDSYETEATGAGVSFELTRLGRLDSASTWLYFGVYIVGSALMLFGLWSEGHHVAEGLLSNTYQAPVVKRQIGSKARRRARS